jgi:hypothetical protein
MEKRNIKKFSNELINEIKRRFQKAALEEQNIDLNINLSEWDNELIIDQENGTTTFSDELISKIATLIELSLITNTPYTFYFQQLVVEEKNKKWYPTKEFVSWFDSIILSMSTKHNQQKEEKKFAN